MMREPLLTLAELPDVALPDSRPLRLGAAVFCSWLAVLGLLLAELSSAGPWHVLGLVVVAAFGLCALRLLVAAAFNWRS